MWDGWCVVGDACKKIVEQLYENGYRPCWCKKARQEKRSKVAM